MRKNRIIAHVDMDAFFASIEQRDNPALLGKSVIVGADPKLGRGRGVVSASSYEAREFGVYSAMPISLAFKKCPNAVFLPVDMQKYEIVSGQIYDIFSLFTPDIEPVSIDEAFLDITSTYHLFGTPAGMCLLLKKKIKDGLGLTASIGLAPTKMAAKIASDLQKPDGMVEVKEAGVLDFLWPLDVRKIWGLGKKTEEALSAIGVKTIGDLANTDVKQLIKMFGKNGISFWRLANGYDEREVESDSEQRSVSNEITFEEDTADPALIESAFLQLSEKVSDRLRKYGAKCKTVTLKIRLQGFETFTRSVTIARPTDFADELYKSVKSLYNEFDRKRKKIRLVGVKASRLAHDVTRQDLFEDFLDSKNEMVHSAVDKIRNRFGSDSIYRAGSRM